MTGVPFDQKTGVLPSSKVLAKNFVAYASYEVRFHRSLAVVIDGVSRSD